MLDPSTNLDTELAAMRPRSGRTWDSLLKRLFDILAAALGLFLLSPLLAVLAILIKREDPGPVYYRGRRVGRGGREFQILKYRTMYERPESYSGSPLTAKDDSRITPIGRWLRRTKVNELPQLWNVLKGEMSLVGPRPEDPAIVSTWPQNLHEEILSVRPGITSPGSVIYRDEEQLLKPASVMDDYLKNVLPQKLRLDQLYVRNHSFLADLDVIFMTLIALLPQLRKRDIHAETLYSGPLYRLANRYFSWFVVDTLIAFLAVTMAAVLWRLNGPLDIGAEKMALLAVALGVSFSLVNSAMGLGRVWWRHASAAQALDLAFSAGLCSLLLMITNALLPAGPLLPYGMLLVAGLLACLGFVSVRYRQRLVTGLASRWLAYGGHGAGFGERVLIVGAGECALLAAWLLRRSSLSPAFRVVGMVDDDPSKQGMLVDGHHVLGFSRRIPEIVAKHDVGVILFAIEKLGAAERSHILGLCKGTSARVVLIPDLLTLFRQRLGPHARSSKKAAA